ncbi:MAG: triple tyrosine motif-containing protein, partial [Ferruginibacter sp.]
KWTATKGKNNFEDGVIAITDVPKVQINKITIDSKGLVWVGTPENGVYVINPDLDKVVLRFSDTSSLEKKLPERGVSSILEYNDSLIIVTTATRVFCYNRLLNQSHVIGSPGTISGFITAVEKDRSGFLWLTSTSGLYRIDLGKNSFVRFGREDGFDNELFTQSASYKLPDGRLMFGTTNDILLFDPAKINIMSATPDIKVTDFKIMGKPLPLDSLLQLKEIELGYQDNSLDIKFSPLVYSSPCIIKYKMDGLEKEWQTADKNNEAIYSFLPPGDYTFLIKAVNEEGKESMHITRLKIKVTPPFWKTWWFYSLVVLAIVALLFWLDKERMKRKETIQKMRAGIADNLYQDVNTALSNINILSEMAKLKTDKDPEKSKEFIQQINSKSQQMMVAMDDMLWGISPENDSMQKTIERIKEHVDGLRNQYGSEINLLIDKKVESLQLDMQLRQHICWLIKGGSANIVRTGATECNLHIGVEKNNLVYTIEFNSSQSDMLLLNNLLQRQELAAKLQEVKGTVQTKLNSTRSSIVLTVPVR